MSKPDKAPAPENALSWENGIVKIALRICRLQRLEQAPRRALVVIAFGVSHIDRWRMFQGFVYHKTEERVRIGPRLGEVHFFYLRTLGGSAAHVVVVENILPEQDVYLIILLFGNNAEDFRQFIPIGFKRGNAEVHIKERDFQHRVSCQRRRLNVGLFRTLHKQISDAEPVNFIVLFDPRLCYVTLPVYLDGGTVGREVGEGSGGKYSLVRIVFPFPRPHLALERLVRTLAL